MIASLLSKCFVALSPPEGSVELGRALLQDEQGEANLSTQRTYPAAPFGKQQLYSLLLTNHKFPTNGDLLISKCDALSLNRIQ